MLRVKEDLNAHQLRFIRTGIVLQNSLRSVSQTDFDEIDKSWEIEGGRININGSFRCPRIEPSYFSSSLCGLKFGTIAGDFSAVNLGLTTLENCPLRVGGRMNVMHNKLTSLKYSPTYIGISYEISNNLIESLEGFPLSSNLKVFCHTNTLSVSTIRKILNFMMQEKMTFELALSILWDTSLKRTSDAVILSKYLPSDWKDVRDAHRLGIF